MDFRYLIAFALLIQLAAPVFGACVGYTDSFDARVLDGRMRPIEGAEIVVKFDRGTSFGEQYFTTPPKYTDSMGKVHFDILNQGTTTRAIDCKITINGSAGGSMKQLVIEANKHGSPVDIILTDVYPLKFFVRDQARVALPNASVTINDKTTKTDEKGMVQGFYKLGDYNYFASYMDASQSGTLRVANDTEFEVLFPHYAIQIDVMDDAGEPLPITLMIFNQTFDLPDGHFENERTFGEQVPYELEYRGIPKSGMILPASEPVVSIVYDTHAPTFGDVTAGNADGMMQLTINVTDTNEHASGIDFQSMKVLYKVEPSDATTPWSSAVTFTSGRSKFTAQFPELPPSSVVNVKIEVKDKEGNRAEKSVQFSTLDVGPVQNNTQNQTGPQEKPDDGQAIPLLYIVIGIIIVAFVIYTVIRLKPKAQGGA